MPATRHLPLLAALVLCNALALVSFATRADAVPGQVLVKYRRPPAGPQVQGAAPAGHRLPAGARVVRDLPLTGWQLIELPGGEPRAVRDAVRWFRNQPGVVAAEPNYRYQLHAQPGDPLYPRLTGLPLISAPAAWDTSTGSTNVIVAVCDTGIDYRHPDLAPNMWRNPAEIPNNGIDDDQNGWIDDVHGIDVAEGDGDPLDDAGHGTHVAGTIGAVGDNARGIAGVCWKVRLLSLRVGRVDGFASTVEIISAFDYAVKLRRRGENLRVINCSWGGGEPSAALLDAIQLAGAADILVVCSAGNDRQNTDDLPTFPADYDAPQVLSVAASTACDEPASFSNFGRLTVDLAAPGSAILSTYRSGTEPAENYAVLSGTSMAAPHVSGAAALLWSIRPDLTVTQMKALILATVDPLPAWKDLVRSGGRLNLARAVRSLLTGIFPAEPVAPVRPSRITAITRNATGRWANDHSTEPAISADGRWVAFTSDATNLVAGDSEGFTDIFLHDRETTTTVRVSQTPQGTGANANSGTPVISADGRFVAFVTRASNLAASDANGVEDVYLWSRETGQIELASIRANGRAGSNTSDSPALSADGNFVAFASEATDLVAGDRNGVRDVFVRDRAQGITERVSVATDGSQAVGLSDAPAISGNGRWVAFHSSAPQLTTLEPAANWNIYVRDRTTHTTELISLSGANTGAGDGDSVYPAISGDGRFVMFHSLANNFGQVPADEFLAVFLRDRQKQTLTQVSPGSAASPPEGDSYVDALSEDGRYVTYTSNDPRVAPGGMPDLFRALLWDRLTGTTQPLGISEAGYRADDGVFLSRPSRDGRFVVLASYGYELTPEDGNGVGDIFVLDRGLVRPDLGARTAGTNAWTGLGALNPNQVQRVGQALDPGAVAKYDVTLVNAGEEQAFLLRTASVPPTGWSIAAFHPATNGTEISAALVSPTGWVTPVLPAGGKLILRVEVRTKAVLATPDWELRLTAHDANGTAATAPTRPALDGLSLVTHTPSAPPGFQLVSRNSRDGTPANRTAEAASLSADGRYVVFSSDAENLDTRDDANFQTDLFLFDRQTAEVRRISDASATNQANADSQYATLSADGKRVAYQSRATNLVPFDTNDAEDIFVRDLTSGVTSRASLSTSGAQGDRGSESAYLSANGRFVAFTSFATNLVTGDANQAADVFLRDLDTGTTECLSRASNGAFGNADSDVAAITADGRFVLFTSYANNLVAKDTNGFVDLFLWDRTTRSLELISANAQGGAANGPSAGGNLSDDGRWVAFFSYASDLGFGGDGVDRRPYLLDRQTHTLQPVASVVQSAPDGLEIRSALLSPNGDRLALGLAPLCGQTAGPRGSQVFVADRTRQTLEAVSVTPAQEFADDHAFLGHFSADGRFMVFESFADNLRGESSLPAGQVYLADLAQPGVDVLGRRGPATAWRGEHLFTYAGQTLYLLLPVDPNAEHRVQLRLQNTGDIADRFLVRSTYARNEALQVRIEAPGADGAGGPTNLTSAATGTGWWTPMLAPNAEQSLEVFVTIRQPFPPPVGVMLAINLEISSLSNPARKDLFRTLVASDADRDGIEDGWEIQSFGNLTSANATSDADRDGASDLAEWYAGTDATSANSFPRLRYQTSQADASHTLLWNGHSERYFSLERSTAPGGAFEAVTPEPIPGAAGPMQITDVPADPQAPVVYRLRIELP